jgi:hypothetical protein
VTDNKGKHKVTQQDALLEDYKYLDLESNVSWLIPRMAGYCLFPQVSFSSHVF